jgi:hypothetical protein
MELRVLLPSRALFEGHDELSVAMMPDEVNDAISRGHAFGQRAYHGPGDDRHAQSRVKMGSLGSHE